MRHVEGFRSIKYIAPILVGGLAVVSSMGCGESTDISKNILDCSKPGKTEGITNKNASDNIILAPGQAVNLGEFPLVTSSGNLGLVDSDNLVKPTPPNPRYTLKNKDGNDVYLVFENPHKAVIHNPDKTITAVGNPTPKGSTSELAIVVNCK